MSGKQSMSHKIMAVTCFFKMEIHLLPLISIWKMAVPKRNTKLQSLLQAAFKISIIRLSTKTHLSKSCPTTKKGLQEIIS
jgi:hypothetical protein